MKTWAISRYDLLGPGISSQKCVPCNCSSLFCNLYCLSSVCSVLCTLATLQFSALTMAAKQISCSNLNSKTICLPLHLLNRKNVNLSCNTSWVSNVREVDFLLYLLGTRLNTLNISYICRTKVPTWIDLERSALDKSTSPSESPESSWSNSQISSVEMM